MKGSKMAIAIMATALAGCWCTTISDRYSMDGHPLQDAGETGTLRHEQHETVSDLNSLLEYSPDVIPAVITSRRTDEIKLGDRAGLHGFAWLCTVGIIPTWDTYENSWQVEIKTPIGVKTGGCTRTRREYQGWIPYLLPFAVSDEEAKAEPTDELARRVIAAHFKPQWTAKKVASLNTAERQRIEAKRKRADTSLAAGDWKSVIALCTDEKDKRFVDEYKRKVREAEIKNLAVVEKAMSDLLAKSDHDEAEKLFSAEYANWKQVDGHDISAWKALFDAVDVAIRKKELSRIERRKEEIEQLLRAGKYDKVFAECDKEKGSFAGSRHEDRRIWRDFKITVFRKRLEARLQEGRNVRIKKILAFANKFAADDSNFNFFGFFVGMSRYDAIALAKHHGLRDDEYSIAASGQGTANDIWLSTKAVRRFVKKGDTFEELVHEVGNCFERMNRRSLSREIGTQIGSALATMLKPTVQILSLFGGPDVKSAIVYTARNGAVARMYDGKGGGLRIVQEKPNEQAPIATEAAKLEFKIAQLEIEADRDATLSKMLDDMVAIPGTKFKIGKHEVTQGQWMAVMGENPSEFKGKGHPVENVSWDDCKKFLEKLNALPEVKAAGWTYRLPTEAEWKHSCRAGAIGEYCRLPDGTEITGESLGKVAWYVDNSHDETHAVGQKAPNAFGLYGMHGNVWEWCEDLYSAGYAHRVCLGGSWNCNALRCTAAHRRGEVPSSRGNHLGFRLAASRAF